MTSDEQISFTVSTFTNLRRESQLRVQRARQLRDDAHARAEKGEENYRIAWLKESVSRVFHCLEEIALEFNAKHPDESCTVDDYGDILMSTLRTLRHQH